MIKSKVFTLLREYLGEYLYGLQEDQLEVAVLSGVINFSNANFRPDKVNSLFTDLALPCTLKAGLIGTLQVKYHYTSFFSNPVEVSIDNFILVLGPLPCQTFEPDTRFLESSLADDNISPDQIFLKRFARDKGKTESDSRISCEMSEDDGEDEFISHQDSPTEKQGKAAKLEEIMGGKEGFAGKYFEKVLGNLTLKMTNVHIRYEDDTYPLSCPFSVGVCWQTFSVKTVPQELAFQTSDSSETVSQRPHKGAIAKAVSLDQLSLYVSPMSSMLIPTSLWEATQSSPIGIFDALPAYEVKDLALQESKAIFAEPSQCLLSPVTTTFTLTLDSVAPRLKVCISLQSPLRIRISAAMIDAVRGFWDYYTSVQMWPYMRRYRPFERMLLIHRSPDEPEFVSNKRRRIVRKWFIYACRFIQAKRKIVELAHRKQRQAAKEKDRKRKEERYTRHNQKTAESNGSFRLDDSGWRDDSADSALGLPKTVGKAFSFLLSKPRRVPGTAVNSLSAAVAEYNRNLPTSPIARDLPSPRPAPQEVYFKPPWNSIEAEIRAAGVTFVLEDERWALKGSLERVSLGVEVVDGRLGLRGGLGRLEVEVGEERESSIVLKVGRKEVVKEEFGKNGLFGRGQKRNIVVEKAERALVWTAEYRPGAFKALDEPYPSANMYTATCTVAQANVAYSHTALVRLIELFSAYRPSNTAALAEEQTQQIDKQRLQMLLPTRKQHRNKSKSALLSFISQTLAQRVLSLKSQLHSVTSDADSFLSPINFSVKVDFGGVDLALIEEDSVSSVGDLYLPPGLWEVEKAAERLRAGLWGFKVTVNSSVLRVVQFAEVRSRQTVGEFMVRRRD